MQENFDLLTIGGGAAGFFGALTAAQRHTGLRTAILERGSKPLGKVLVSGGGRCNVTHACFDPQELVRYYPRGADALLGPFQRFQPADTIAWFEARGVRLKTEPDGRVFPVSDRAQTIIDCLLAEARRLDVAVHTRCAVRSVEHGPAGFTVRGAGFNDLTAARVLLAPGGAATSLYESAARLGHTIIPPVPSLFTFQIADPRLAGLQGVAVEHVMLRLTCGAREFEAAGPLLVTHWGLSGPAVLKLSAWAARELAGADYQARLEVSWLPEETVESVFDRLQQLRDEQPGAPLPRRDPSGRIPARLWRSLALGAGISETRPLAETSNRTLRALAAELTAGSYAVQGKGVFKEEFVTCGGVALSEVDFETMESRLQAGLYFAGEILDIDGLTGGFNFQSAWTTGWLAGQAV